MARRLPAGWKAYEFDCVATIASGQVDPKKAEYSGLPLVGSENLPSGGGELVNEILSAREMGAISGKYLFKPGQVIYSKIRPNLNKVWLSTFEGLCSADIYPITFDDERVIAEYAYYYMLSDQFRKIAVAASMRSGIPKVNRDDLSSAIVIAPNVDEQRRIVSVLGAADRKVALIEELLAKEEARYQSLLRMAFRPLEQQRTKGWRSAHLGDMFAERNERSGDLPLLAITGEHGVVPRDELERRDTSAEDKSGYKVIRKGDIGYNTMRMWQGVFGLSQYDGIISPAYTVVTPDRKRILGEFASHLFSHPRVVHTFHRYSQGLVDDTLMLKYPHFSEIRLPIPDISEQRRIAQVLDAQLGEIGQLRQLVRLRRQQHRGLMQKLLTGQWPLDRDLPGMESTHA